MNDKKIIRARFREGLYRRRFILPNTVTVGGLFCGFLACVYSASGQFQKAALSIGIAIVLDGLDGRVARRFNATSKFGVEFDSLADLVSFGVAPALLLYHWCFSPLANDFGVFVCFLYLICAAGRLARFNVDHENLKSFTGLPTPGAAGFLAAMINFWPSLMPSLWFALVGAMVMAALSYLMVSRIEFFSVKLLRVSFFTLKWRVALGSVIALTWYNHQIGLFVIAAAYVLSGPLKIFNRHKIRRGIRLSKLG